MAKKQVWFWQRIVSPHMVNLAIELAKLEIEVHYVIEQEMSVDRAALGWKSNLSNEITLHKYNENGKELLSYAQENAEHIVQGIRGNGYISSIISELHSNQKLFWIIMETVDLRGWTSILKTLEYKRLFFKYKKNIKGVFSIGHSTKKWLIQQGIADNKIIDFAYFLKESQVSIPIENDGFKFIYVGSLIERKRIDVFLSLLKDFPLEILKEIKVTIIGDGDMKETLQKLVNDTALQIEWLGVQPIDVVRSYIAKADCLVLPSSHDGWGAVTTEALIEGTPVICSDACGSAGSVICSGEGGVFPKNDLFVFKQLLLKQINSGSVSISQRTQLKIWAKSLTAESGAKYMKNVLLDKKGQYIAPWEINNE